MTKVTDKGLVVVALIIGATVTAATGHEDAASWFGIAAVWAIFLI